MLRRIRELMATPFARPPGRRSLWARFAPEWCAGFIYLTALAIILLRGYRLLHVKKYELAAAVAEVLQMAAGIGYTLFGIAIILFPLIAAAQALAAERSRGTMEAMVLTPLDGRRICLGRLLHVAGPWLRLFLWMLPIYVLVAGSQAVRELGGDDEWTAYAHIPSVFLGPMVAGMGHSHHAAMEWTAQGCWLAPVRGLNDLSVWLFLVGGAYLCSLWFRTSARALLAAWLLVFGSLGTVMTADVWGMAAIQAWCRFNDMAWAQGQGLSYGYYAVAAPSLMALRLVLGLLFVWTAARKFDAWACREAREGAP